jgi:hypothetical protein
MIASRTSRLVATATAALSLSACGWDCGTLTRTVASGTMRDAAGTTLATAQVNLTDEIGPSFLRLGVGLTAPAGSGGAPMRGHVTRARLTTESGEVLADIPTGTETLGLDVVVALNAFLSRPEYDRVRSALLSKRAKVIVDTDLPGREHIETTLPDVTDGPGVVQRCRPA